MKFRVTYKTSFNELKTLILEEVEYISALVAAKAIFGDNLVSVEDLEPKENTVDGSAFDPYGLDWLSD